ncbi:MAG: ATP-sensitive inward rectifier potassium channel 10 [Candidatus Eremiobacteraeota bacterium]|nr:ATP-sensitive inward rectifier potassium channel 10 [Candidatus Eremiobacteraeota bacterium]
MTRTPNPDGSPVVQRIGAPRDSIRDLYHMLLSLHWGQIALLLCVLYCGLSLLFAELYMLGGDCINGARPGHLIDYFFFSVQTLATIGYGVMHPVGDYANCLVSFEAFCGLLAFSLMTGLLFAKFSIPNARVLFSNKVVMGRRDGKPALMFRMANARGNHILEAHVNLTLNRCEPIEGDPDYRRFHRLPLVVSDTPLFVLTFLATHIIDESSPLYGIPLEEMKAGGYNFTLTLIGLDALVSQTVHARWNYDASQIAWDHRFVDTLFRQPDGSFVLDYTHFHEVVPYLSGSGSSNQNVEP